MNREFIDFVTTHEHEDTARLLLSAARYPSVDMPAAVQQIEGRRTAREKWPSLLACDDFLYPPRLNREQASSEETARHKAALLADGAQPLSVADLTGGMGVDTLAFAAVAAEVHYVERNPQLCRLMEHNDKALGQENIRVHCADSLEWLVSDDRRFDILFVDPARRAATGRKVAAFEDCEPDILQHLGLLRSRCRWLMVKASPMIDIDLACRQLGAVAAVHVVSVRGECKEVLFVCCGADAVPPSEPVIRCTMLPHSPLSALRSPLRFTRSEEAAAGPRYCAAVGSYLYEPDAALMKGGGLQPHLPVDGPPEAGTQHTPLHRRPSCRRLPRPHLPCAAGAQAYPQSRGRGHPRRPCPRRHPQLPRRSRRPAAPAGAERGRRPLRRRRHRRHAPLRLSLQSRGVRICISRGCY